MLLSSSNKHFNVTLFVTIILTIIVSIFILVNGKAGTFQIINSHHTPFLDDFFKYYTYAGDGGMWVVVLLFTVIFRREYTLMIIAGIIISTILSQFLKRVVFPDELRPITYLSPNFPVHTIKSVFINQLHSFPSGHTSAAFTMALLTGYMLKNKWWAIILPLLALLVGYSRVYLAQHFVTDVLAGMIIAIISAYLSIIYYNKLIKRKTSSRT